MPRFLRAHGRLAIVLGLVLVLAAACAPPVGKPALRQVPNAPRVWDNSDPAVLVYAGKTYLFGSTNNKRVPVRLITTYTDSLAQTQAKWAASPVDAMPTRPAWVDPGESQIWAPSVARIGTRFVMYFAAHNAAATTDEGNDQCIGRSFATTPMGPYSPEAGPVYCGYGREGAGHGLPASNAFGRGALDPEVFRAPDGTLYLLVALSRTLDNIGVVRLHSDGTVSGGRNATPTILASQSMPWHDGRDDSVRNGGFLENPTMIYDKYTKTYLLFFSAGQWSTTYYNTSFARCAAPTGPCSQDTRGPFLKSGNGRAGPGGLTAYLDPLGRPRVAYASWQAGYERVRARQTHWAALRLGATSDPAGQVVSLG
ncbi:MAG: family 43 glycosylhydrolase [Acidimicrobiales bacterium]